MNRRSKATKSQKIANKKASKGAQPSTSTAREPVFAVIEFQRQWRALEVRQEDLLSTTKSLETQIHKLRSDSDELKRMIISVLDPDGASSRGRSLRESTSPMRETHVEVPPSETNQPGLITPVGRSISSRRASAERASSSSGTAALMQPDTPARPVLEVEKVAVVVESSSVIPNETVAAFNEHHDIQQPIAGPMHCVLRTPPPTTAESSAVGGSEYVASSGIQHSPDASPMPVRTLPPRRARKRVLSASGIIGQASQPQAILSSDEESRPHKKCKHVHFEEYGEIPISDIRTPINELKTITGAMDTELPVPETPTRIKLRIRLKNPSKSHPGSIQNISGQRAPTPTVMPAPTPTPLPASASGRTKPTPAVARTATPPPVSAPARIIAHPPAPSAPIPTSTFESISAPLPAPAPALPRRTSRRTTRRFDHDKDAAQRIVGHKREATKWDSSTGQRVSTVSATLPVPRRTRKAFVVKKEEDTENYELRLSDNLLNTKIR